MQWVLVIVTTITAAFIGWQAWETRKSAKAAATSVDAINRQAGIMERQTAATEKSAEAARDNAIAAKEGADATKRNVEIIIAKERPRIRIELGKVEIARREDHIQLNEVEYIIFCHGITEAYILDSEGTAEITNSIDVPIHHSVPISLPTVIRPTTEGIRKNAFIFFVPKSEDTFEDIFSGRLHLHFYGWIRYKDVFERERITKFRYRYVVPQDMPKNLDGSVFAYWSKYGPPEDNCET